MRKRQPKTICELYRASDDKLVLRGTAKEIGEYIGRSESYINHILNGHFRFMDHNEGYYLVTPSHDSKKAPGCKYVKNFQLYALREYGNTIIRDSHKKHIKEYIEEFKKFGLDVEIYESGLGNLIAMRRE